MVTTVYASVCRSWSGRTLLLFGRAPPYASRRAVRPAPAPGRIYEIRRILAPLAGITRSLANMECLEGLAIGA